MKSTLAPSSIISAGETATAAPRPAVRGKSLYLGTRKLTVAGVTYGPFGSGPDSGFSSTVADRDFAQMVDAGINAIRLYAPPQRWLLDLAHRHGLLVMIGVPWEQHIAFLQTGAADGIERTVRSAVRRCAGHPAVLCYAIGNEISASIVRWHGRRRVERFLDRLARAARQEDPGALVTYVNFPPTEYLRLPSVDFLAFNVYLEQQESLERYLARLQNVADDRPLLMAELGLDSRRNGQEEQADSVAWQLETSFAAGCAGAFVFAWTDEWHRGGHEILDWDFGLTTRAREPKPALQAVRRVFSTARGIPSAVPPRITVVICTNNGSATLRECLDGVTSLDYPDYEAIVVSDGSTDDTAQIAAAYDRVRVIETPQRGLAAARNTGMEASSGEIVAYIDDDAIPEPDWLEHLATSFASGSYAAVGGPNVPPAGSGAVAQCVSNAPGGPTHVLLSDRDAEHIPGCNMAVRKTALQEIGGFDPTFRAAGDDVDVCWRLLDSGRRIGFNPGAVVCHHRRSSVRGYLRQQRGYGKAEALLERKHPEKYSAAGHVGWTGRLYGNGAAQHRGGWRWRVYYGGWGTAFYQSIYGPRNSLLESLPLLPEWYLVIALLALLSAGGAVWAPLLFSIPLFLIAVGALIVDAALGAMRARFAQQSNTWRLRLLTGLLYLLQPVARLHGRITHGLTPWRRRGPRAVGLPVPRNYQFWCERWQSAEERLRTILHSLCRQGSAVRSGGDWDRWDLEIRGGLLGVARLRVATEEHGAGRQLVRIRSWPRVGPRAVTVLVLACALATLAAFSDGDAATVLLAALAAALLLRALYECGAASAAIGSTLAGVFAAAEASVAPSEPQQPPTGRSEPPQPLEIPGLAVQLRLASCARKADVQETAERSCAIRAGE